MADPWPSTLPQYLESDGFAYGYADGRLISQTDTGPAKVRRRSSAMPRPLQGRMTMDGTQLATLLSFVNATLIGGTLPFEFPDPVTRSTVLVRFAGALPTETHLGADNWSVALELEVLP